MSYKLIIPLFLIVMLLAACGGAATTTAPAAPAATTAPAAAATTAPAAAAGQPVIVGLITKTESNPFFVKMKEGAAGEGRRAGRQVDDRHGRERRR